MEFFRNARINLQPVYRPPPAKKIGREREGGVCTTAINLRLQKGIALLTLYIYIYIYVDYYLPVTSITLYPIYIYSQMFENIPQNGPEYSHRKLAIASFLVTAVRKNIGGLLSWLVSLSSSVPELARHGLERGFHVNPQGGRVLQKRCTFRQSLFGRVSALVMSAFSLSCQILVTFEAHWPRKAFPSGQDIGQDKDRISALLSTERLQTHVFTMIRKIFMQ